MNAESTSSDNSMRLPPGKTCRDCAHFNKCAWLINCKPTNKTCDWAPSRFRAATATEGKG